MNQLTFGGKQLPVYSGIAEAAKHVPYGNLFLTIDQKEQILEKYKQSRAHIVAGFINEGKSGSEYYYYFRIWRVDECSTSQANDIVRSRYKFDIQATKNILFITESPDGLLLVDGIILPWKASSYKHAIRQSQDSRTVSIDGHTFSLVNEGDPFFYVDSADFEEYSKWYYGGDDYEDEDEEDYEEEDALNLDFPDPSDEEGEPDSPIQSDVPFNAEAFFGMLKSLCTESSDDIANEMCFITDSTEAISARKVSDIPPKNIEYLVGDNTSAVYSPEGELYLITYGQS